MSNPTLHNEKDKTECPAFTAWKQSCRQIAKSTARLEARRRMSPFDRKTRSEIHDLTTALIRLLVEFSDRNR